MPAAPPRKYNATPTLAYAKAAIQDVIVRFGGDPTRLVLLGHSRGAIATQAIGFADAAMASLWRGFVAASHYDAACPPGPRRIACETWPYAESAGGFPGAVARARLAADVPKFLTGECDLETGMALGWLQHAANVSTAAVTAVPSGFRDHTGFWIARPSAARTALRSWLERLLGVSHVTSGVAGAAGAAAATVSQAAARSLPSLKT